MSDSIRALEVRATADTSGLQQGMQQAQESIEGVGQQSRSSERDVSRASGSMSTSMTRVATAAKTAGAAAVVAGAAYTVHLVRTGLEAADEQAKLARQLGITNEELATLQRAADLADVSSSELTRSMERLNRGLGDAIDGSGATAEALERIGLSAAELVDMRPDEQFEAIGDAMQSLGSHAQRASVANDLFGRSGQRMMLLLDDAGDTIDRARREVEVFNLALDETQTDAIEALNDNISTLGQLGAGTANTLAATLAPALGRITSGMIDFAEMVLTGTQRMRDMREASDLLAQSHDRAARAAAARQEDEIQAEINQMLHEEARLTQEIEAIRERKAETSEFDLGIVSDLVSATWDLFGIDARNARQLEAAIENREIILDQVLDQRSAMEDMLRSTRDVTEATEDEREANEDLAESERTRFDARADYDEARRVANELVEEGLITEKEKIEEVISAAQRYIREVSEMGEISQIQAKETVEFIEELEERLTELTDDGLGQRLDMLRDSMRTEREVIEDEYEERREILRDARERDLIDTQEFFQLSFQAYAEYQERLVDMAQDAIDEKNRLRREEEREEERSLRRKEQANRQHWQTIRSSAVSAFRDILEASASSEEGMFRARQAAGIAEAVVNTAVGITRSLSTYGGTPLGWAAAAAVGVAGAAQIASILSASPGSAGSAQRPSPGADQSTVDSEGQQAQQQQRQRTLMIQGVDPGQMFSGEQVRELMDRIGEAQRDGYRVVT